MVRITAHCVVGVLLVCVAAAGSWRLLSCSDVFSLTNITVVGNEMISDRQVLDQVDLHRGMNILTLDRQSLEQQIASHPWIDEVRVHIRWPSEVQFYLTEHRPVAMVNLAMQDGQALHYIDRQGVVFSPVQDGQDMDFPVITGQLALLGLEKGRVQADSPVQKGLDFILLARKGNSNLPIQDVSEVHISAKHGLIVYLVEYPFPIYLGNDHIRTRYYRLVKMLNQLYRKKQMDQIKAIRMDYEDDKALVAGIEF